jgi:hypothetical protein
MAAKQGPEEPSPGEQVGIDRSASLAPEVQVPSVSAMEHWPGHLMGGSLPLDKRLDGLGGTAAAPVAMFAPVHLVASRPLALGRSATLTGVGGPEPPVPTISGPAGDRLVPSPAAGDGHLSAGAEADPVGARVGGLLAEAEAASLTTVKPADATYDFDEYALLAAGSPGEGLFPPPAKQQIAQTILSLKVHGQLGAILASLNAGYKAGRTTPELTVLVDQLHKWWLDSEGPRAWNRLQLYDPDALRLGKVSLSWEVVYPGRGEVVLSEPTREEVYATALGLRVYTTGFAELLAWLKGGSTAALGQVLTGQYWRTAGDSVLALFSESEWPTLNPSGLPGDWPFVPFPPEEPLFGLRVVHRQTWRRQGYARGGLVRTIPLAPRETRRISVRVSRRTRVTRGFEEAVSLETTMEQATTTKGTDEVVGEATSKLSHHTDAEVSGGYEEFFQARVSDGLSEETGTTSRHTKTQLNELMAKTAARLRRDTKVTVTSETETGFEETTASELANPNDEVAITYLYHRLQEQFWVHAEIAEVNSVVLVPEPLPAWQDIDASWIRDYADPIGRALLDERYRPVLDVITTEPPDLDYPTTDVYAKAAAAGTVAAQDYKAFTGGTMPDLLASGQQFFAQDFQRRTELAVDAKRRKHQAAGLVAHVRRNILHYLRAVWASEDYDQRIQRHGRRLVPTAWVFVPATLTGSGAGPLDVEGTFVPDPTSVRPLSDVIDPTGPVSWLFNCAIYRLRDDPKLVNLHQALAYLRATYARFAVTVTTSQGAGVQVRQQVAYSPRRFADSFTLEWQTAPAGWRVSRPGVSGTTPVPGPAEGMLDVRGVRLWLDGTPTAGAKIDVDLRVTPEVEDPHLRLVKLLNPLPAPGDEAKLFTTSVLADMARVLPDVGLPTSGGWVDLDAAAQAAVLGSYHRYLLLRDSGRLVTVDTANLVLELEASTGVALEPFKRLHRYIDVLKEEEERRRRALDNTRRNRLLADGRLGDPDIERVTVVSDGADDLAVVDPPDD